MKNAPVSLRLDRQEVSANATRGVLTISGKAGSWYVLEPSGPDSAEEGSDQRIPAGSYRIAPYSSPKYPNAFELKDVPGRTYILIHPGNFHSNTEGCLMPGKVKMMDGADLAVGSSRNAFNDIKAHLNGTSRITIDITNSIVGEE
ncbi:hypothetical protein KDW99_01520 [Marinomonas rhizomae]|uniref:DUF5675 family protein n=1 Tax=Marinomonas rhizomae TaxID=491948 RepID=UPI00210360E0|nr:DUF5675 family protein [Marinomonas rhizomae]UTV99856.1 hypothetical protein KDW99_01520 [Marinomonas rhizomae]